MKLLLPITMALLLAACVTTTPINPPVQHKSQTKQLKDPLCPGPCCPGAWTGTDESVIDAAIKQCAKSGETFY